MVRTAVSPAEVRVDVRCREPSGVVVGVPTSVHPGRGTES